MRRRRGERVEVPREGREREREISSERAAGRVDGDTIKGATIH